MNISDEHFNFHQFYSSSTNISITLTANILLNSSRPIHAVLNSSNVTLPSSFLSISAKADLAIMSLAATSGSSDFNSPYMSLLVMDPSLFTSNTLNSFPSTSSGEPSDMM